ncbi:glycoside hydrolase family 3 protein [Aaosphaeria arxii CBS 175.79]|uniref:beta-glucosidase n=1 Tax=Aaosphaeria arxii CBS 175.79 TaxID=1450172 RepID=A0A6A5Y1J7_9PLEO|nr:glycoside hydrolase family 3 protein [Aaosphaeria arxii CBS 175.79]KAF2018791.1 glycoside hydrolase family 3 protein [Aaosphaeria arxii CBS 175.79]
MMGPQSLGLYLVLVPGIWYWVVAQSIPDDQYFYGQSPPVYSSPPAAGPERWAEAFSRAKELVGQMTLEEKVNLTTGVQHETGCSGMIHSVTRLGFPGLCLHDAGHGVTRTDFVNSWSSNIHVGASWNKDLARQRAERLGGEFQRKGINVMLGPSIGPLGRIVTGGRNWEGFSIDPYLSGELVSQTVLGIQSNGVTTCVKHFIGNEQEMYRNPSEQQASLSSNIDDVTMHELYLWPFYNAIRAGAGSVMCSYQRLNNSYACQNSKALNGLLKDELGFQGFVVTDWGALHAGHDAAAAGLDMAMPYSIKYWGPNLVDSVRNGSLPERRLDDMAVRILSTWYRMKQNQQISEPGHGLALNLTLPHKIVDARDPDDQPVILQSSVEGHVLVKNVNKTLPLRKPKLLSILGYSATAPMVNMVDDTGLSTWGFGLQVVSGEQIVQAILEINKDSTQQRNSVPAIAKNGTLLSGSGSGTTSQTNYLAPFDALKLRAEKDQTQLFWDFSSPDPRIVGNSDACLVFGNAFATESFDRPGLKDNYTDTLILNVAKKCSSTIVILHNAGTRLADPWIEHPNVTAVIYAHLPGQEPGRAIVSLLYGDINFSGKLPYTIAKQDTDYGNLLWPETTVQQGFFEKFPQSNFTEGVYVDYRHFDRSNINPRFEFGFGLSYTLFNYSDLAIQKMGNTTPELPSGSIGEGGQIDLWETIARASAVVSNIGDVDGAEVAQLYIGIPGDDVPVKQLRGFEKPFLKAGEKSRVWFDLLRRDLSVWDAETQRWRLRSGSYQVWIGASSRRLPLHGTLEI